MQQIAEDWNDSTRSKEQVEARKSKRQEAAIRRERAMAYAFSHQVPRLSSYMGFVFWIIMKQIETKKKKSRYRT